MASLHVGNLNPAVTEKDLVKRFQQAGPLESVKICRDFYTQQSLCYGYVNFQQPADAEWAMETYYGQKLMGRPMKISWSRHDAPPHQSGRAYNEQPKVSAAKHNAEASRAAPRDLREKLNNSRMKSQVSNGKKDLREKLNSSIMTLKIEFSEGKQRAVTVETNAQIPSKSASQARPAVPQASNRQRANPVGVKRQAEKDDKSEYVPQETKVPGRRLRKEKSHPSEDIVGVKKSLDLSELQITLPASSERNVTVNQAVPTTSHSEDTSTGDIHQMISSELMSILFDRTDIDEKVEIPALQNPDDISETDEKDGENKTTEAPKTSSEKDAATISHNHIYVVTITMEPKESPVMEAPTVSDQDMPQESQDSLAEGQKESATDNILESGPSKVPGSPLRRFASSCRRRLSRVVRAIRDNCTFHRGSYNLG